MDSKMFQKQLKTFRITVGSETKKFGYENNMESFILLSDSFDEALEEARKRIYSKKGEVIEEIVLLDLID